MQFPVFISVAFHIVLVLVSIVGLPFLHRAPEVPAEMVVVVDLVELGERTAAPPPAPKKKEPPKVEPKPEPPPQPVKQEPKPTPPKPEPEPVPEPVQEAKVPEPPPPPPPPEPEPEKAEPPPPPPPPVVKKPEPPRKPPPPKKAEAKPEPKREVKKPEPKEEDFAASMLKALDTVPTPKAREAEPQEAVSPEESKILNAPAAAKATASEEAMIKAQIERHYGFDAGMMDLTDLVVVLRVDYAPDGRVLDIVEVRDGSTPDHPAYVAAKLRARNAIYRSAPIEFPPGRYEALKRITFPFKPSGIAAY